VNVGDNSGVAFEQALMSAACAAMICDTSPPNPKIRFVNTAFTRLTGYSAEEAVGRGPGFLQGPDTDAGPVGDIAQALVAGVPITRELLNYRKDGKPFWNQLTITPIRGESGAIQGFLGLAVDCTADHAGTEASEAPLQGILEAMPGYVYRQVLKANGRAETEYLSPSIAQFVGEAAAMEPQSLHRHVHSADLDALTKALETSARNLTVLSVEFRLLGPGGSVRWVRSRSMPVRRPNGDVVWDGLAVDVTAERGHAVAGPDQGAGDPLTGLGDREDFRTRLRAAVERVSLDGPIVVYRLDLDGFHDVNEFRGETVGDEVLRRIGLRLSAFAAAGAANVARIGGDEFAVIMPAPASKASGLVEATAQLLCDLVQEPLTVGGQTLVVRASVGATIVPAAEPGPHTGAQDLAGETMKQADLALQAAKREDPGGFRLYDAQIDHRRRKRVAVRQSLTEAIANEQLQLHYQPIVSIDSGSLAGAEALVRWNHPTLGLQAPETFIPLAESSGLIVPLGDWVLAQTLRQGALWRRQGLSVGRIAINLSGVQLRRRTQQPDFLATVEAAVSETGADPQGFEFELTESVMIESSEETLSILKSLKAMGFGIAIDDFGTGHASFRYLRDLLFDKVKIDRSFISGIGEDGESEAIVSAMVRLTRMLGARVVGEGVESMIQRDFLYEQGCEFGQGYLFGPPAPAAAFALLVERGGPPPGLAGGRRARA
jgi:diguanylate cyclase (GGDEF)-like protein/PAS domain S-box-containing protein